MQNPFLVGPYPPAPADEAVGEDDASGAPEVIDPDAYPAEVVIAAHRCWGYMLLGVLNAKGQVERVQITTPSQLADAAREATYAEFIEEHACLRAGGGGRHWVAYYFEERTGTVSYQDYGKVRRYTVRFPRHLTITVTEGRQTSVYMWAVGRRPSARYLDDPLYAMPIGNVYDGGWVCLGSIQQSDLAHRSPEAIDRLILEESHYTAAAMSGCSRSHPDTVLALWQEMHMALTGPAGGQYRYPMDDLVPARATGTAGPLTVRDLYSGAYPFTRLS
jgi:hypothetical protein